MQCPVCGSEMKQRTNKKGEKFWGCSQYPNCTGTKPIARPQYANETVPAKQQVDKKEQERVEGMKWLNALNNASLIVAHYPSNADPVERVEKLANRIYELQPEPRQTHTVLSKI